MALLRFIVLQTILAAALIAMWLAGPLQQVFAGDSRWFVCGVLAVGVVGLALSAIKRTEDVAMVMLVLPILAVLGMQGGIKIALEVMAQSLSSAGDPTKSVGGFAAAIASGLNVSISALACYLWLHVTLWLTHGK